MTLVMRLSLLVVCCSLVLAGCAASERTDPGRSASRSPSPIPTRPHRRPITIVAAGDICRARPSSCSATAQLVSMLSPDAVLPLGDNQYHAGGLNEYLQSYDRTWGRFRDITHPVAGNHEWLTPSAQGYLDYFELDRYWYTFKIAGWRFYALDATCRSNGGCGEDSTQFRWLRRSLSHRKDRCIVAYWHQPRFSSGTTHGSDDSTAAFWRLLYAAGADLILDGHEHNYERFSPQDPDGHPTDDGIVEIVAGTGSSEEGYPFGPPIANSEVRLNAVGVVRLALFPHRWVTRFVEPDLRVADRARGSC
jgi:hypothetical protein